MGENLTDLELAVLDLPLEGKSTIKELDIDMLCGFEIYEMDDERGCSSFTGWREMRWTMKEDAVLLLGGDFLFYWLFFFPGSETDK